MVPFILREGWELIAEHPHVKMSKTLSCHRPGSDTLMALKTTRELNLFEAKWYKRVSQGLTAGTKDARDYPLDEKNNPYGKVVGAYAAALDWDPDKTSGNLHVKRAK
jgi:hypothetical protein